MNALRKFFRDTRGNSELTSTLLFGVIGAIFATVVTAVIVTANTTGMSPTTKVLFDLIPFFFVVIVVYGMVQRIRS